MYIRFCLPKCSSQLNIPTPLLPPTSSAHPPTSKISLKFQEMISNSGRNIRYPFTASQWQELEHQALIFKYMVSGMPIPPDLLYTIRRSLDSSSLSSQLLLHQPQHVGWNCFQMGFGRKIDPEPGRCRRTDGKKWRCSKEAYPDSKYCERHMHRGRNRSRKPVEVASNNNNTSITAPPPPTAIPISSITKNPINHHPSSPTNSLSCLTSLPQNHPFLYPHSSNRPLGTDLSSQENSATTTTTNFLLESGTYSSHAPRKSCYNSYGQGGKEEIDQEHAFFSETSGSMRNISGSDSWQLTMGSPLSHQMKQQRSYNNNSVGQNNQSGHSNNSSYLQLDDYSSSRRQQKQDHHQYLTMDQRDDQQQQPKKVMHHFFDEWPPKDNKDSWIESDEVSKIQLSISMPNSSHDFFMTRN